jgi:hypothetical protein
MPHVLQRASWAVPLPKGWGLYSTPNHKPHARGSGGTPSRHHPCAAAVTDGNAPMNATWHDHHPPPSGLQHQQRADTHHEGIVCVAASTESQSATGHRRGGINVAPPVMVRLAAPVIFWLFITVVSARRLTTRVDHTRA